MSLFNGIYTEPLVAESYQDFDGEKEKQINIGNKIKKNKGNGLVSTHAVFYLKWGCFIGQSPSAAFGLICVTSHWLLCQSNPHIIIELKLKLSLSKCHDIQPSPKTLAWLKVLKLDNLGECRGKADMAIITHHSVS